MTDTNARYRKKPIAYDAHQWQPSEPEATGRLIATLNAHGVDHRCTANTGARTSLTIRTLEGEMTAQPGDWIIVGHKPGEAWPVREDIFAETYEPAASAPTSASDSRAALAPVIELCEGWTAAGAPPLGVSMARWWDARLVELNDAIAAVLLAAATVPAPAPADRAALRPWLLGAAELEEKLDLNVARLTGDALKADEHVAPADRAAVRGRIAALFRSAPGQERLGDATPGEIADAVLAEIPGSAVGVGEDAETLRSDLYDDLDQFARETGNTGLRHAQIRDHLATFLAEGLLRRLADAASGPGGAAGETQQDKTPAPYPPTVEWHTETRRRGDHWSSWSCVRYELAEAQSAFAETVKHDGGRHAWRLIRETTTYDVEAEQPAAVSQPGKDETP
jgi:hypothetical protein